ncbi:MAG: insulinase family protein [Acidobacteria bacterium]|nr:insulinase family protein [Acidobacteriota bacterium]
MRSLPRTWAMAWLSVLLAGAASAALRLDSFATRVHEFTLANGLRVVLVEDHAAPVVTACFTARGGYADDPQGMRGMSNLATFLLEEGPETLGSRNLAAERAALKNMTSAVAAQLALANRAGTAGELDRMEAEARARVAARQAEALAKPRFSVRALEQYGVQGFQVSASADALQWSARLPSNRIDAFLLLYGEWLKKPFPRMVYANRERMIREHTDASPTQDLILRRALLTPVFGAGGYGLPPIEGAELANIHYPAVESFLQSRLAAANLTLSLAGDLTLAEAQALAARYLTQIPAGQPYHAPAPPPYPVQELRLAPPAELSSLLGVGYRRPPERSPDDPVFDLIAELLIDNPLSRIRTSFAKANPLIASPVVFPSLPGARQGGLMVTLANHHPSRTPEEWTTLLCDFFESLGRTPPTVEEMDLARRSAEGKLTSVLAEPARAALYLGQMGGWKPVEALVAAWGKATPADVQRVAAEYLRPERRLILQPGFVAPAAAGAAQ